MNMKIIISLILLLPFMTHAQFESIEDRIRKIEEFRAHYETILDEAKALQKDVEKFSSPKLISKDQTKLDNMKPHVSAIVRDLEARDYLLSTKQLHEQLASLKKVVNEREEFKRNEKRYHEIQKVPGITKRLEKYFESVNEGKSTQAKVLYNLLNAEEKDIAQVFDRAHTHVVRERNVQESLDRSANEIRKKIEEKFSYSEKGIEEFLGHKQSVAQEQGIFKELKDELALDQYDLKFDSWTQGLFNCKDKPKLLRPKNFPDLLLLTNDGNLRSVIKVNPNNPNSFETLYKCKDVGQFGICRDDSVKELCRLDANCLESLARMEGAYERAGYFQSMKQTFPSKLLQERKKLYLGSDSTNILNVLEEMGKLGFLTRAELIFFMDPIIEMAGSIEAKTPEEYLKKAKLEIEKHRKRALTGLSMKYSKGNATQLEDTKNALNYVFTSMNTELEKILKDDEIQGYAYETCQGVVGREVFCQSSKEWREKSKVFDETSEIHNLLPKECPRLVLRMNTRSVTNSPLCLPMDSEIDKLNQAVKGIEHELNK